MSEEELPVKPKPFGGAVGRPKGVMNKSSFYNRNVKDVCKRLGLDPIEALARFVMNLDPATGDPYSHDILVGKGENAHVETIMGYNPDIRLGAAKELASFVAPKRKAVEHSAGGRKKTIFQVITEDEAQAQQAQAEANKFMELAQKQAEDENSDKEENENDNDNEEEA